MIPSKMNAYKDQNFEVIQQTRMYIVNLHTNNTHTKFQSNIPYIWPCNGKKQGKVMTSPF